MTRATVRYQAPRPEDDRKAWDRQPGETAQAFEGFAMYRDLGEARSLAKVRQGLGKSRALVEKWSRVWCWVLRVESWEVEQDRRAQRKASDEILAMRQRHADAGVALMAKAVERLQAVDVNTLTPTQVAAWMATGAQLEARARGDGEFTPPPPAAAPGVLSMPPGTMVVTPEMLRGMSDDELDVIERVAARGRGAAEPGTDPGGTGAPPS